MPDDPTTPLAAALHEAAHRLEDSGCSVAHEDYYRRLEAALRAAPVDAGPATEPEGLPWRQLLTKVKAALGIYTGRGDTAADSAYEAVARALTASEPGLDAAWREAEAAITRRGTGGTLLLFQTLDRPSNPRPEGERYCAKVTMSGMPEGFFYGPTPAAALRALAARLRSTGPDQSTVDTVSP